MELKKLPKDVHSLIQMCLDLRSLLNMKMTCSYFPNVFLDRPVSEKNVWLQQTINLGIYRRSYEELNTVAIIALIKTHVTETHEEVKRITDNFRIKQFKIKSAALTFAIVQDDDAEVKKLLSGANQLARNKFILLMIQLGCIRCVKNILKDQVFNLSYIWMLTAIYFEQFAIVEYFIDQHNFPLYTTQACRLMPTEKGRFNPHYKHRLGDKHFRGDFRHYNRVLLIEAIRCRDVRIVQLIQKNLDNFLYENEIAHPEKDLYAKLKRHSIAHLDLSKVTPDDDESRELLVGSARN